MEQTSEARIQYVAHAGTTPEREVDALAAVYAYLLKNRKAAKLTTHELDDRDGTESKEDSAGDILPH